MATAKVQGLKRIDFDLFVSCLRFPLNCYQLVIWVQDKITQIYKELGIHQLNNCKNNLNVVNKGSVSECSKSSVKTGSVAPLLGCLQTRPPQMLELHRIKQYLTRYLLFFIDPLFA